MIKNNLILVFVATLFCNTLFSEQPINTASIKTELKTIESKISRISKSCAAVLGIGGCAYLEAILLNWCTHEAHEDGFIEHKLFNTIGHLFHDDLGLKGRVHEGMEYAKLLTAFLITIPNASLGVYFGNLALKKLKSPVTDK